MLHLRRIIGRATSLILTPSIAIIAAGLSPVMSADTPLTPSAPSVNITTRDDFACGQGPGRLKMTMQSNQEMAQACAKAGEVAGAYAAAQPASAERSVSVNVDGASWACVQKTMTGSADSPWTECSHADEVLSLSEFRPVD